MTNSNAPIITVTSVATKVLIAAGAFNDALDEARANGLKGELLEAAVAGERAAWREAVNVRRRVEGLDVIDFEAA